jgi:hypothetical protein
MAFCLVICSQVRAQDKITYFAEVRDSKGAPLQFANAIAIDTLSLAMEAFAVSDRDGQFKLALKSNKVYKLQITFIGYIPFEGIIRPRKSNEVPYEIVLTNDVTQLSDVEVVQEMPVLIQGDTITYKTDVFTQGNERKLEDVLQDLPGFEVDKEGGVKVQGKDVNKLLVDGKEFFGGDTRLATKNLPANVVDKVQLLQNYNDIGPLSGVNNSDALALNIQLKEDKKNMVFGDIELGGGPKNRYFGHINSFYYDPKTNINLIADANNVGKPAFSLQDYFRFNGGLSSFARGSGSSLELSSNSLGIPLAERNNAFELENQLAALNFNLNPTDSWRISGFAIGSKVDNTLGSISNRTYVLPTGDNKEILASQSDVKSTSGLAKINLKYVPNSNLHIDYSAFGRLADLSTSTYSTSIATDQVNIIQGVRSQKPIAIEQQIRGFWAMNDFDIVTLKGSYKYQNQDPTFNLLTSQQPFSNILPLQGESPFDLIQFKETSSHHQEAAINYYRILNKTNHLNMRFGNMYSQQQLTSQLIEKVDYDTESIIDGSKFQNDVDFTFTDLYASLLWKSKWGNLEFSPSLNWHYYDISNKQNDSQNGFSKSLLLPAFNAKYKLSSSHSLTFNYEVKADFTDIENIAQGILLRNYNNLFEGNPMLRNSIFHEVSLSYFNFNMYNFLNLYGGLNYSRKLDDVSNMIAFNGLERISSPINIEAANEVFSAYANADKRFDGFRTSFSANWSKSLTNNIISDVKNLNESFNHSYQAKINTTLWKIFQLEMAYQLSLSNYHGQGSTNRFENHQPSINFAYDFLNGFSFELDYRYNDYINKETGNDQNYDLMDVELRYRKEKSPWEFKIEGMNIFNTRGVRMDSFNSSLISTYEYFIQKRYWLFTIKYDL